MTILRHSANRAYLRLASFTVVLLPLLAAGCDDDDFNSREILDIIYAVGDVVLGILLAFS